MLDQPELCSWVRRADQEGLERSLDRHPRSFRMQNSDGGSRCGHPEDPHGRIFRPLKATYLEAGAQKLAAFSNRERDPGSLIVPIGFPVPAL